MIMVLTHHLPLRTELTEFLDQQGYEVLMPDHREDVYVLAQESNPQVVVLDLSIAKPNALKIVKHLRNQGFTGKILIVAGASVRNAVPEVFRLGAEMVIGGPQGNSAPFMGVQVGAAIRSFFHEDIQRLALLISEERGGDPGRDWEDWFNAERQILQCLRPSPAEAPAAESSN